MAATPTTDPVATAVAGDGAHLLEHGAVRLRGYVHRTSAVIPEIGPNDQATSTTVNTIRIYTSTSFDRWIEVPESAFRHQMPARELDEGRSLVWIDADAVITHGQTIAAASISPSMEATDDPTTYPGWPR